MDDRAPLDDLIVYNPNARRKEQLPSVSRIDQDEGMSHTRRRIELDLYFFTGKNLQAGKIGGGRM